MLRLTEIRLPIDHAESVLTEAIISRLDIPVDHLLRYVIVRRGHDARKPAMIMLVYTLDVEIKNASAVLAKFNNDKHISIAPDTHYKFVAQAPKKLAQRPVVIGLGPAGLFAGLILAQMGFRPWPIAP